MDQQTKAALKQDNLLVTTETGLDWVSQNRKTVIAGSVALFVLIVAAIVSFVVYNKRAEQASEAFGAAMQAYQTPIAQPSQPILVGTKTYNTPEERAKAANVLFLDVANKYSMMPDGKVSLYFAGLTYMESGQTKSAEDTLKKVADGMDKSLGALAKFALAQLYRQSGRDALAIDLYNQLTDKPTATVPAGLAQLQLAELYASEGKVDLSKKIYAHLKDTDAKGVAGTTAAAKLNPAPAGGGAPGAALGPQ